MRGFSEGDLVASETSAEIDPDSPFTRAGQYNLDPGATGVRIRHRRCHGGVRQGARPTAASCPGWAATRSCSPGRAVLRRLSGRRRQLTDQARRFPDRVSARGRSGSSVRRLPVWRARETSCSSACRVIDKRLKVGLEAGATRAPMASSTTSPRSIATLGDGRGADVVIDAAGASASLRSALDWVRPSGR